ncbi:iron(III) transport system substrate-binding protein [Halomonas shengliensis]|uniref:Iron(III) transport system substrate-binding protein n=1 Tax=Halomonas shengliensis TaxID=419597 RepID=A0A1H0NSF5_9GAMM|nr:ABC transporter substrate-binding protein [Halomonas shengliensis]SDO95573.1 iron(III) transport system substrate-binding protein [Halomonas shengliensis]
MTPRRLARLTALIALWVLSALAHAQQSLHLPAAEGAGTPRPLVIHAALDLPQARPLLAAFQRRHPEVAVTYHNLTTLDLHERFLAHPDAADVVISSAMPWQFALANAGHARPLGGHITDAWPAWARWRDELVAFTFEPIVMVVHQELTNIAEVPRNHAELLTLLEERREALTGRVATYDPVVSGVGRTYAMEESRLSPRYWDLVAALGAAEAKLVATTGEMLDGLEDGSLLIGYNLLGSYALPRVEAHPDLALVVPDDYALVTQRVAFVPRQAPHPETGTRFVAFLLSEAGQRVIAKQTSLGALHPGVTGPGSAAALRKRLEDALRPPGLGPGLLAGLDRLKRQALLARWRREFRRAQPSAPSTAE